MPAMVSLIPGVPEGDADRIAEYRTRAKEMLQLAGEAPTEAIREGYLQIATSYTYMARHLELRHMPKEN